MALRRGLVALLLPLLVACAEKEPAARERPADVVRAAGDRTVAAGTARVSARFEAGERTATGGGVTALDGSRADLRFEFQIGRRDLEIERRVVDGSLYLRLKGGVLDRGTWYRFDADEAPKQLGGPAGFQPTDPSGALAYFRGVADDVREAGTEEVRGTRTTRYEGTFDLAKARDAHPDAKVRKALDAAIKAHGGASVPMTVWVDGEGRLRRVRHTVGETTVTVELYEFGVPVDVTAPPPDQIEPTAVPTPTARTSPTG